MDTQKCRYCDDTIVYQPHFACHICNAGMCNDCYDSDVEHDKHFNKPLELIENENFRKHILKWTKDVEPEYLCEKCMEALSKGYKDSNKKEKPVYEVHLEVDRDIQSAVIARAINGVTIDITETQAKKIIERLKRIIG